LLSLFVITAAAGAQFYGMDLGQDSFDSETDWQALQNSGAKMIQV
jgi:hypothetical protein